ncbi:putative bone morphogenetic protein 10 isoform X2 [Penaeus vannamei]|uniref:Putative bone morphogenetic protein 10 isoform X2 n=1 Tax=Penaeus vannamei TaxID=6689 RepID=A0A3R7M9W5_PENVA|nr:putative bone morphogenetic protein 10 isoform X2 [Penaeus vannamei]
MEYPMAQLAVSIGVIFDQVCRPAARMPSLARALCLLNSACNAHAPDRRQYTGSCIKTFTQRITQYITRGLAFQPAFPFEKSALAYQCSGKCFYPLPSHLSPTKHAVVQNLVHSLHPDRASRACCVPTLLGSISLLYLENNIPTFKYDYDDMVVLECGCR